MTNKRLLIKDEIRMAIKEAHQKKPRILLPVKDIYDALLQAQDKKTLQEVGEWLDKELSDPHNEIEAVTRRKVSKRGGRFYTEDIKTFQRGEMPR